MPSLNKLHEAAQTYISTVLAEYPAAASTGLATVAKVGGNSYSIVLSTVEQMVPIGLGNHAQASDIPDDSPGDVPDDVPNDTHSRVSNTDRGTHTPVSDSTDA